MEPPYHEASGRSSAWCWAFSSDPVDLAIQIGHGTILEKPLVGVHSEVRYVISTSMAATFSGLPV